VVGPASHTTINTFLRPRLQNAIAEAPLSSQLAQIDRDSQVPYFPCVILRHQPSGRLIGTIKLFQAIVGSEGDQKAAFAGQIRQTVPPAEQSWAIGYNLLLEWRGKGVAGQMLDVVMAGWVEWVGIGAITAVRSGCPMTDSSV
jgi:hypothetical protein